MPKEPNTSAEFSDFVRETIKKVLNKYKDSEAAKNYDSDKSTALSKDINKEAVEECSKNYPTFKYLCSSVIVNKKQGGVHMTSSCYWDSLTDGYIQEEFDTDALKICVNMFVTY